MNDLSRYARQGKFIVNTALISFGGVTLVNGTSAMLITFLLWSTGAL